MECIRKENPSKLVKNISGKRFGMLTVISFYGVTKANNHAIWKCLCECGKETLVFGSNLIKERTRSCGCYNDQRRGNKIHNYSGYNEISGSLWSAIRNGANGMRRTKIIPFEITIQDAWNQFIKQNRKCALTGVDLHFGNLNSSVLNMNDRNASLDRIDSSGSYTKENIQWVHKDINRMKNSFPQEYFIEMCKLIAKYNS